MYLFPATKMIEAHFGHKKGDLFGIDFEFSDWSTRESVVIPDLKCNAHMRELTSKLNLEGLKGLLAPELCTSEGQSISLSKACLDSNAKIATLATTLLNLQTIVLKGLTSDELNFLKEIEKTKETSDYMTISPNVLQEDSSPNYKRRKSCYGGITSSSSSPEIKPQAVPSLKKLERAQSVSIIDNLTDHTKREEITFWQGDVLGVFEKLVSLIKMRISKTAWTRDLHEFIGEVHITSSQFSTIGNLLNKLLVKHSRRSIRYMAASQFRPCWALDVDKLEEIIKLEDFADSTFSLHSLGKMIIEECEIILHTIYIMYDFERESIIMKLICSPVDGAAPLEEDE